MTDNILDFVPASLRFNEVGRDIAAISAMTSKDDFDTLDDAINFASGAAELQSIIAGDVDHVESKVFKLEAIEDMRFFIRKHDDNLLGSKARLYFEDKKYNSDKIVTQSLDTSFMPGSANMRGTNTFTRASARTNAMSALFLMLEGKKFMVRKVTDKSGDTPAREASAVVGEFGSASYYMSDPLAKALPDMSRKERIAIVDALCNVGTPWDYGKKYKPFELSQIILKDNVGSEVQHIFVDHVKDGQDDKYNLDGKDDFDNGKVVGLNAKGFIEDLKNM